MDLTKFNEDKEISLYSKILKEFKNRDILRFDNSVGDLAEYWTKKKYSKFIYQAKEIQF